jgi:hypothetical protein
MIGQWLGVLDAIDTGGCQRGNGAMVMDAMVVLILITAMEMLMIDYDRL